MENKIKVYIKLDSNKCITDINSSIFLKDMRNYICISEGQGDKYSHAQGNYLEKPLIDFKGRYNYKYVDNSIIELTEEEKESLFPIQQQITEQEKINAQLLMENAEIKKQLTEQQKVNANMLMQIAKLGGVQ